MNHQILVFADWEFLEVPVRIGLLNVDRVRGKEVFSFEYDSRWLQSRYTFLLDPDLQLYSGPQYLQEGKPNFGIFSDSSPDRWGRVLMRRREAIRARKEERRPATLFETDYLLGAHDRHRMGALRFKTREDGPFLDDSSALETPPMIHIRELEQISLKFERDDALDDPDYERWLNMLLAPGSSLGGARPKANVMDADGCLWIAKFPSLQDDRDMGGWEMVTHDLALEAGISMAPSRAQRYSSRHHTFLTRRFDRTADGGAFTLHPP
ncbi:MAG: HipA domain-containing protein [Saprospiraceae bacterium]